MQDKLAMRSPKPEKMAKNSGLTIKKKYLQIFSAVIFMRNTYRTSTCQNQAILNLDRMIDISLIGWSLVSQN